MENKMKKLVLVILTLLMVSGILFAFTNTLPLDKTRARVTAGYDTTKVQSLSGADAVDYTFAVEKQDSCIYYIITDGKIYSKNLFVILKRDTLLCHQNNTTPYKNVVLRTPTTDNLKGFEQIRFRVQRLAIPTADSLGTMKYYLQLRTK